MSARRYVVAFTAMFVVALVWVTSASNDRDDKNPQQNEAEARELARIVRGFEIAPVPLNLRRKDLALVGLGSYLVNAVGGCNDCHTNPAYRSNGNPFNGDRKRVNAKHYLAGGAVFGPFISRNLTDVTDEHTFEEFLQIIRHGKDFDEKHPLISPLLQVMPWPVYQDMTTHELRAIYEYLSTIPAAEPCVSVGPLSATQTDPTCVP